MGSNAIRVPALRWARKASVKTPSILGQYVSVFGIQNQTAALLPPAIGANCAAWRKKIAKGIPLFKIRITKGPVRSLSLVKNYFVGAPDRVRCPTCNRPIRLSRWWEHGCELAITRVGEALGDFYQLTKGAAAPVYEE